MRPPRSLLDELTDDPLTFLGALFVGSIVVPAILVVWRDQLTAWCLSHQLLVPAPQAVLTIPGVNAGLDLRRAIVLGLLVIAGIAASIAVIARRRQPSDPT